MSLEINYIDAPEDAQSNMTITEEYGSSVSNVSALKTGAQDIPYATLEPGLWRLDGTMRIIPDDPKVGFWSAERSGNDGRFLTPPRIVLHFSVPFSSTGVTFVFSPATEQWCSEIHVWWYNGQTLLKEGTYYPGKAEWTLNESVESFDRIQIELRATNKPGHFAKLRKIDVGRVIHFDGNELANVRLVNEVDPSLCVLTADTLNFTVIDRENRNLLPQENQRIELIKDGKVKAVQYIVSSTREAQNQYRIACQSAIGLLEDTYLGGLFDNKPLRELVEEILGGWQFEISSEFETTTVSGYLPVCSQREALQQLAFAIGAVISTQGGDKIRFLPVPTITTVKFRASDTFLGGKVKTSPRVAKVQVYSHSYAESDTEQTLIRDEEIIGTDVLLTFDAPHHSYTIFGGVITDFGVNWVKINSVGRVTLTGKEYEHLSIAHTKRNPAAVAKEQSNYIAVSDVTLINSDNVQPALERLFSIYQFRQVTEQEVVVTNQTAGDLAVSITPWGSQTRGYISTMDSELTQSGHTAKINIQGIEVALESVWMYSGEVCSGGMEVVY